jgi:hypothetical protein
MTTVRRQLTDWENIFASYSSDSTKKSRIYRKYIQDI